MPNHITNRLKLFGDESDIRRLMEAVKNDEYGIGTLDFDKIIPMPDNIYRGPLGKAEMELYGENNWYDWSIANRGTKWGAYGYEKGVDYSENGNSLRFLTAWSAPHPVIEKLAQMYPTVKIEHEWADEDIGSNCGRRVYSRVCRSYKRDSRAFPSDPWHNAGGHSSAWKTVMCRRNDGPDDERRQGHPDDHGKK